MLSKYSLKEFIGTYKSVFNEKYTKIAILNNSLLYDKLESI